MKPKKTILIVEDKGSFRLIYKDLLESEGYRVLLAQDGEEGWGACVEKKPDLVLLDLRLPDIDGFEVLRRIRGGRTTQSIPVLVFSVMDGGKEIQRALAMGANGHIVKGFQPFYEVVEKIGFLLGKAKKVS